jgi:transposase-like protein
MGRKKAHTPEKIIAKLRQAEVAVRQGKTLADAARSIGVTEPTYYRWRTEFGGRKLDQVRRLKQLDEENAKLKRLVADLTREKSMVQDVLRRKW